MTLEPKLIEPLIVEGSEFCRQATEGPDEPDLRGDDVNDETEPSLLRKLEPILSFTLRVNEWISHGEKVRVQVDWAIGRKREVTDFARCIDGATHQIAASPNMFRPWHDDISERHICTGLEALQSAFFDQFIAELTELKAGLIVAEARSGDDAKPYVGEARPVAVAVLEAEINHPANDERNQVLIGKQCRRHHLGQNIESGEGVRIAHQGHINKLLDRPASNLRPDSVVFALHLIACRTWRPMCAAPLEVLKTYLDTAV